MPDSVLLEPPPPPLVTDSGRGGRDRGRDGFGDDDGRGDDDQQLPINNARLLTFLGLIASTMLFSGLFGAFVMLRGSTKEWPPPGTPPIPPQLWINTLFVVASSIALVVAHVAQRRGNATVMKLGLLGSLLAAGGFLALQTWIWKSLVAVGFALRSDQTNNYIGRFYMLTGAHFLHAVAGFIFLLVVTVRALAGVPALRLKVSLDVTAIIWHFVDLAWISIWLLLAN